MIRAILTDIEGTTSSISFVKDVLFPYARAQLPAFLHEHWASAPVRREVEAALALAPGCDDSAAAVAGLLQDWIDEDRKATPLKALQGMIWKAGYENGDFRAHVYADTAPALRRWHQQGLSLYVYSSGSVPAQKLFFSHCEAGDLTPLFSDYFDTRTGAKQDEASYRKISEAVGLPAAQILFLSDIEAELDAARAAGMHTRHLDRTGAITNSTHEVVQSFDEIDPGSL